MSSQSQASPRSALPRRMRGRFAGAAYFAIFAFGLAYQNFIPEQAC